MRRRFTHRLPSAFRALLLLVGALTGQQAAARAQDAPPSGVLFENVRIFSGTSDRLSPAANVLVVGNTIRSISTAPIAAPAGTRVTRIQGGGRTLMPGLIDAHTHLMFASVPQQTLLVSDAGFISVAATRPPPTCCSAASPASATWAGRCRVSSAALTWGWCPGRASGRPAP
jgi:hypothetical protein